jgi:phosphatidylglycerol:prolipoprotein diacylglycerol transferase
MLRIGSLEFRYYGLVYFFGFLTIYLVLARKRATGELPFRHDQVEVLVMFGILCMMAGARLFEILFYNPAHYLANPLEVFKIWEGGSPSTGRWPVSPWPAGSSPATSRLTSLL